MNLLQNIWNKLIGNELYTIFLLIVVVLIIFIIFMIFIKFCTRKKEEVRPNTDGERKYTLKDCTSKEDFEFKIGTYQKSIEDELLRNKNILQEAKEKGYIKTNIEWTNRFQELNEVSYTLEKNLEYENSKKLNADKFHRYANLHFRSMIIGNLAYEDYISSKKVRDELGSLLVDIGKKKVYVNSKEKKKLYDIKDTAVKTTKYLYERMISIQNETGNLRDKIRDECGSRGKEWYKKNISNKEENKAHKFD